jgi:site-specific recombinase XerD
MKTYALSAYLQRFFTERLGVQIKASPNTVASYRDTFRLLLRYAADRRKKERTALQIADIDADLVGHFLADLEKTRGNGARSRNTRLAAVRSFFKYVAVNEPQLLTASECSPCRRSGTRNGRSITSTARRSKPSAQLPTSRHGTGGATG